MDTPPFLHTDVFAVKACIPPWIEWQRQNRDSTDGPTRAGINYSIVLGSACYVEGFLELSLLKMVNTHYASETHLQMRLVKDLIDRIGHTMGMDKYDQMFKLVYDVRAERILDDPILWESATALFGFRHMLAHGRAVTHQLLIPSFGPIPEEEELVCSYKKTETYLLKKQLIAQRHAETFDFFLYFKDEIADHFWKVAKQFSIQFTEKLKLVGEGE